MRDTLDISVQQVKTCLDESMQRPDGPQAADIAQAMRLFVGGCWMQQHALNQDHAKDLALIKQALYGEENAGGGLMDMKRDLCRLVRVAAVIGGVIGTVVTALLIQILSRLS